MLDRWREHGLAATGLALALIALALALVPASGEPQTTVLALRHSVDAGMVVRPADVVAVPIAVADRTPSMLSSLGAFRGRRTLIGLAGGDFLVRGALHAGTTTSLLRPGERAVALEVAAASAPDARLLHAGRRVDVVVIGPRGARSRRARSSCSRRPSSAPAASRSRCARRPRLRSHSPQAEAASCGCCYAAMLRDPPARAARR